MTQSQILHDADPVHIDISKSHALGITPRPNRESHTVDLAHFTRKCEELRAWRRAPTDPPYHEAFWSYMRGLLVVCQEPVGYESGPDARSVSPKGPQDVNRLFQRIQQLGLINPIYPALLATAAQLTIDEVLTELLYAAKVGMMTMRWAPECTRCGSAVLITELLNEIPSHAHCGGCQHENHINSLDHIMVTFTFSPDILYVLANNYACKPSSLSMKHNACFLPMLATHNGSGFRYSFGCGADPIQDAIPHGTYRVHCPVSKTDNYLIVKRDAEEGDEPITLPLLISELVVTDPAAERARVVVPHGKLHIDLFPDTRSFFVLWVQEDLEEDTLLCLPSAEREPFTSAAYVLNHSAFHLFKDQVVPYGARALEIQDVILVFTDIVGSTDLYAELGDGEALHLVREHFKVLFNAFAVRGRIVKTIGDAVMASFSSGRVAIEAVAEAFETLARECVHPISQARLELRIGVHRGSTIVIPVNGINDYFGQTVNIAARVQSAAGSSQCYVSEAVLRDQGAQEAFDRLIAQSCYAETEVSPLHLKGVQEQVKVRALSHTP